MKFFLMIPSKLEIKIVARLDNDNDNVYSEERIYIHYIQKKNNNIQNI